LAVSTSPNLIGWEPQDLPGVPDQRQQNDAICQQRTSGLRQATVKRRGAGALQFDYFGKIAVVAAEE
jgi:hypothetical protein